MASDITARIILIGVLLLLHAVFAAGETAFSSCNKIRIRQLSESGNKAALRTEAVLEKFDSVLVAILVGTNVSSVFSAAVLTMICVDHWGETGTVISTVIMTVIVFILCETLPKTIAKANADKVSMALAGPFRIYSLVLTPVSFVFEKLGDALRKAVSGNIEEEPTFTEDEFQDIVESIEEEGVLEPEETEIIQNTVEFSDTKVKEILRPVAEVVSVNLKAENCEDVIMNTPYSRIPVQRGDGRHFSGFLRVNDYLIAKMQNGSADPAEFVSPLIFLSSETKIPVAFEEMKKRKCHMAAVRDSNRAVLGIVTMENILDEIVGLHDNPDGEGEND